MNRLARIKAELAEDRREGGRWPHDMSDVAYLVDLVAKMREYLAYYEDEPEFALRWCLESQEDVHELLEETR